MTQRTLGVRSRHCARGVVTFREVSCGTELDILQEGLPSVIPVEACYLGWQESLSMLAKLVEAEIPDGA